MKTKLADATTRPMDGHGWQDSGYYTLPSHTNTAAAGGGSVAATRWGSQVTAGTTAGDKAELRGVTLGGHEQGASKAFLQEGMVTFHGDPTAFTDDVYIGVNARWDALSAGTYINPVTGTADAGGSTASIMTANEFHFRILADWEAGKTHFSVFTNSDEDHVTVSNVAGASDREGFITVLGNGGGDNVFLCGGRQWFLPEVPDL